MLKMCIGTCTLHAGNVSVFSQAVSLFFVQILCLHFLYILFSADGEKKSSSSLGCASVVSVFVCIAVQQ